jgi:hypothetical protein
MSDAGGRGSARTTRLALGALGAAPLHWQPEEVVLGPTALQDEVNVALKLTIALGVNVAVCVRARAGT